jgi:hypothetical protein
VTAAGLAELTSKALKICPALGGLEVEESWAGLRPTTPDFLPVLGTTPWSNLYVAGKFFFSSFCGKSGVRRLGRRRWSVCGSAGLMMMWFHRGLLA